MVPSLQKFHDFPNKLHSITNDDLNQNPKSTDDVFEHKINCISLGNAFDCFNFYPLGIVIYSYKHEFSTPTSYREHAYNVNTPSSKMVKK